MNFSLGTIVLGCPLLAVWEILPPVYLVFLIVGGGLLLIATIFGGDGQDADLGGMDVDLDVGVDGVDLGLDAGDVALDGGVEIGGDADVELDGASGHLNGLAADHLHAEPGALAVSNWISVRFFIYFSAMFGLVGTVLSRMTEVSPGATLAVALGSGLIVGQIVHQIIRALQRSSSNSEVETGDFVNQVARVTVSVKPPKRGEVGVRVGNKECFLPAAARRLDDSFTVGDRVVIVAYVGGTAEIVSREEHEFLEKS